jgi:hypothetical protein
MRQEQCKNGHARWLTQAWGLLLAWPLAVGATPAFQVAQVDNSVSRPQVSDARPCPAEKGLRAIHGQYSTQMRFVNEGARAFQIHWLDYQGKRVFYKTVLPHSSHTQPTYLTHPWVLTDESQQCLGVYFPDDRERTIVLY